MNKKELFKEIIKYSNFEKAINSIKSNKGSKTAGVDGITFTTFMKNENPYDIIRKRLENFKAKTVRRVEIPKDDGNTRPLGIPSIEDRIIQMMFKQILEPICEKKFYEHSYGFRPTRGAENAIGKFYRYINHCKLHYCVDIDIKGFFDNINHNKLIKQCYAIGIKDKKVLSIIKEMLKAPIKMPNGEVVTPTKGTPQGGILSPLLANICLNELDWWIYKQWAGIKTQYKYTPERNKYRALKKSSNLAEVRIIRYADDFKLLCNNLNHAHRMFKITKLFLKNRLKLEISKKKSKVVNLRKEYSNFLGFKVKAIVKGKIKKEW
jgi:group II intron reverse transcriptase/maturase